MDLASIKRELKGRGFAHVYEWTDAPNVKYEEHAHKGRVTFYVAKGGLEMAFEDGKRVALKAGDWFDVPVGAMHSAVVGGKGCTFVVGEEIEGDS